MLVYSFFLFIFVIYCWLLLLGQVQYIIHKTVRNLEDVYETSTKKAFACHKVHILLMVIYEVQLLLTLT